jgi:nitrogen fixation-related uncharacterized protein
VEVADDRHPDTQVVEDPGLPGEDLRLTIDAGLQLDLPSCGGYQPLWADEHHHHDDDAEDAERVLGDVEARAGDLVQVVADRLALAVSL